MKHKLVEKIYNASDETDEVIQAVLRSAYLRGGADSLKGILGTPKSFDDYYEKLLIRLRIK